MNHADVRHSSKLLITYAEHLPMNFSTADPTPTKGAGP